jgi:hypothetical protein
MLNALKTVLGLQLNVVLDGHLLVVDELTDLLSNILPSLLSCVKPCLQLLLSIGYFLAFEAKLLLLGETVFAQVLVDDIELLVQHNIKPLLRLVYYSIKLPFNSLDLVLILAYLVAFGLFYVF